MLTKKERETIAERLRNCNEADYYDFYEAVAGEETAKCIPLEEGSIDKLIDSIPVRDKPAKTVTVRTRLL